VLLKKLINDAKGFKELYRISNGLNAIGVIHRETYRITLTEKLSSIVRSLEVEKLDRIIPLISYVDDSWTHLDVDVRQKFESYVENLPKDKFDDIETFLSFGDLKKFAEIRLRNSTRAELDGLLLFVVPSQVSDRIIELYSESESFEQANDFAATVIRYAVDYSKKQIEKIISACGGNYQIENSFEIRSVINSLRKNKDVTDENMDEMLVAAGLTNFVKVKDVEDEAEIVL
jgi:hypothetical protein